MYGTNNSHHITPPNEEEICVKSKSKTNSRTISPKNCTSYANLRSEFSTKKIPMGHILYENSKQISTRLEMIRKSNAEEIKKRMRPEITSKAKKILRNPQMFGERLYPRQKDSHEKEDSFFKDVSSIELIYGNSSYMNMYHKPKKSMQEIFTYKPNFNHNSLRIAKNIPVSPMSRLTNKTKRNNSGDFKNSLNTSQISQKSINKSKEMYEKGLDMLRNKMTKHLEHQTIRNQSYKSFSYNPKINKSHSPISVNPKLRSQQPRHQSDSRQHESWIRNENETKK